MNLVEKFKSVDTSDCSKVPVEISELVSAFGGVHNILVFNSSVSQLRYDVKDVSKVNAALLEKLGAVKVEVFEAAKHVQVTFCAGAEGLNQVVKKFVATLQAQQQPEQTTATVETKKSEARQVASVDSLEVLAPISGAVSPLSTLNDEVFSKGLVGSGLAIQMDTKAQKVNVVAPFSGKITMLPAGKNQFILTSATGVEVVVVVGLNSHLLNGVGISSNVSLNQSVNAGDVVLELQMDKYLAKQVDTHLVLAATQDSSLKTLKNEAQSATSGQVLFTLAK
ncbi:PTS glucose transporter subunit IIA [Mycoplasma corogypsi]|uniref:PTS glucose transporter subunit IIA n=1 Tax=Mycoplasma corogypsi TaxID=2106 RepID=UPI0038730776